MGTLDVPEILIALGFLAMVVWAANNWAYRHAHPRKLSR